jgi:tetratricopeptide (TPR) repeat protein
MGKGNIRPTIRQSDTQSWYDLSDDEFEQLCCDLHGEQKEIATCQLHGTRGQTEKGVDHVAQRKRGNGKEVGQSKSYKNFSERDLGKAVKPFFDHIEHWKKQEVKRYILFVACDIQRTQVHDEKEIQYNHFKDEGIDFELWSGRDIQRELGPYRNIVARYVDSKEIVDVVCGTAQPDVLSIKSSQRLQFDLEAISVQRLELANELSKSKLERLEDFREQYRQGKRRHALDSICSLYNESQETWKLLDKFARGQILRILALYILNIENDVDKATGIAAKAKENDPEGDDTVLRAILAYHKDGPEAALPIICASSTLDAINLRASLLFELGKFDDVVKLLNALPEDIKPNAETKRMQSLSFLVSGNLFHARAKLDEALAEKPNWHSIIVAKTIIDYWSAISITALKNTNPLIPLPISLDFIKRDQDSLDLLDRAEKDFHDLALNDKLSEHEQHMFNIWRLAALAMHPNRQSEAADFCKYLLSGDSANPYVLRWAFSRNYKIDKEPIGSMVSEAIKTKNKNLDLVSVLIGFCIENNKCYDAFMLLDKYKHPFEEQGHYDIWLFWRAHALITSGKKLNKVKKTVDLVKNLQIRNQLRIIILETQYRQSKDWKSLLGYLESLYNETDNGIYLLEACRLMADRKDYDYVLGRGDELIEKIGTPAALYLVVESAWEKNLPARCLNLLDNNVSLFSEGVLPDDLRRLRVTCHQKLGYLNDALGDAKDLVVKSPSITNIVSLMQTQFAVGDLLGIRNSSVKLLAMENVPANELLRAADIVKIQDTRLAEMLWEKAVKTEIDDSEVLKAAITTGYSLCLDSKIDPLIEKMREFVAKGKSDFQMINLRDLITIRKEELTHKQKVFDQYNHGNIPIHLVTKPLGVTLALLYHEHFSQCRNAPKPLHQLPLLARHGSRKLQDYKKVDCSKWRLHLDVTALLLAAELELLEIMEHAFGKLWIPASTQPLLLHEMRKLMHGQPSRIKDMHKVEELLKLRKIGVLNVGSKYLGEQSSFANAMGGEWMNVLSQAKQKDGYLVDFLPLHSKDMDHTPVDVPEPYRNFITGAKALIEAMHHDDLLSNDEYSEALSRISGVVIREIDSKLPKAGVNIFLMGTLSETLATANVLDTVCRHFEVYICQTEVDRIKAELSQFEQNKKLREWIDRLRERLKIGIENGTYETITLDNDADSKIQEEKPYEPAEQLLFDLLTFHPKPGDVVCYDDRHLSSYSNSNGAPIIGITDTLALLRELKDIDDETYFAKLIDLRKGNMRYIPLSKEEILYHLNRAKIDNDHVAETHELSVLRRYWASCLLDNNRLQCPPSQENPKHEVGFLVQSLRAIQDAMIECWHDENNTDEMSSAYSDWILHNMYIGLFGVRHLLNDPDPQLDRIDLLGMDLGGLISSAIGLFSIEKDGKGSAQSHYLTWLSSRILSYRLKADPETAPGTASVVRKLCDPLAYDNKNEGDDIKKYLIQKLLLNIPKEITAELHQDADFMAKIGLSFADYIRIGNVSFLSDAFWSAAAKAVNDRHQNVFAHDPRIKFSFQMVQQDKTEQIKLKISDAQNKFVLPFTDPLLGILSEDPVVRLNIVKNNRYIFDCDSQALQEIQGELAKIQNPVSRIRYLLAIRDKSAVFYYNEFTQRLLKHDSIQINEFLPPSPESLLKHFRLNEKDFESPENFSAGWISAIDILLTDENINEALDRIVCIPTKLTENLLQALKQLESSERRDILLSAERRWSCPISLLHLIDMSLRFAGDDDVLLQIAKRTCERLCKEKPGKNEIQLFITFLKHFEAEFSNWQKYRNMPSAARLFCLWSHSSRLQNIFGAAGADTGILTEGLELKRKPASQTLFNFDTLYLHDVLNPSRVRREHIDCHALGFILEGHKDDLIDALGIRDEARARVDGFLKGKNAGMLSLLCDSQLYSDSLGSILGGDRARSLDCLIGPEAAESFSSTFLHQAAQNSIFQLNKDIKYNPGWINLVAIVGNMPIYDDLIDNFLSILSSIDFVSLYEDNPLNFAIVLPMICEQIGYSGDKPLLDHFIDGLMKIADKINKNIELNKNSKMDTTQPSDEDILILLIDAAYRISLHQGDQRQNSKFFSKLVEKMFNISALLANKFRNQLWHMATQLPADQIHGIWRLLLISRAL